MPTDASGFDPAQDIRIDTAGLRALAHPLRVKLLSSLRLHGSATASQLAAQLGESSGATSYHLRQLQRHGFVDEDTERGTKRERWWRALHRTTRFDMKLDDDNRATGGEYLRAVTANYSDRMVAFANRIETVEAEHGEDWADVWTLSDWDLELTVEQAAELNREIFALMTRYRDMNGARATGSTGDPDTGRTGRVVAQLQLFPLGDAP